MLLCQKMLILPSRMFTIYDGSLHIRLYAREPAISMVVQADMIFAAIASHTTSYTILRWRTGPPQNSIARRQCREKRLEVQYRLALLSWPPPA